MFFREIAIKSGLGPLSEPGRVVVVVVLVVGTAEAKKPLLPSRDEEEGGSSHLSIMTKRACSSLDKRD